MGREATETRQEAETRRKAKVCRERTALEERNEEAWGTSESRSLATETMARVQKESGLG